MAFRITRGIEVNRQTLAVDAIREVGPGGNFLTHPDTLEYFRKERWFPRLTQREKWKRWEQDGAKTMADRANEIARKILAEHRPHHVTPDQQREIERMAIAMQKREIQKQQHAS